MPKEILFIIEESLDGGYEANSPGYSIYTEGETLEELKLAVADAVKCHFDEENMPKVIRLHLVKEEVVVL
ncbi:TPA: 2-oxoisovalerate dehydrogenase [bacterium]|nr:2-oxoisovalerate dehydrogenase [bacterium]